MANSSIDDSISEPEKNELAVEDVERRAKNSYKMILEEYISDDIIGLRAISASSTKETRKYMYAINQFHYNLDKISKYVKKAEYLAHHERYSETADVLWEITECISIIIKDCGDYLGTSEMDCEFTIEKLAKLVISDTIWDIYDFLPDDAKNPYDIEDIPKEEIEKHIPSTEQMESVAAGYQYGSKLNAKIKEALIKYRNEVVALHHKVYKLSRG